MIIVIVSTAVLNGHNFGIFRGGGEVIVLIVLIVVVFALNLLFFRSPCSDLLFLFLIVVSLSFRSPLS